MTLLAVVITYLILRWYGAAKPLHRDAWFYRWCDWASSRAELPLASFALAILGPVIGLLLLLIALESVWSGLQLLVAVPVLLYSAGRGRFAGLVSRYSRARRAQEWKEALTIWKTLNGADADAAETDHPLSAEQENWTELDRRMLSLVSYRGFERTFAVLFWFVVLGPAGALLYRLSSLYLNYQSSAEHRPAAAVDGEVMVLTDSLQLDYARHWLWLLEWPAARVLAVTFAMTGNFVSCMQALRHHFWSAERSTSELLLQAVRGALHVNVDEAVSATVLEREMHAVLALFSRTLIFWICVLALWVFIL